MVTNRRSWWERLAPWLIGVLIVADIVAMVWSFLAGQEVLAWALAVAAGVVLAIALSVRYGEEVRRYLADLAAGIRDRAGVFYHSDAPGQIVPVTVRLAGLAGAVATGYYLPRTVAEFGDARGVALFVVLVAGQFLAQTLAFWLTRPSPGDLDHLRSLAAGPRSRGTPDRPRTTSDVIDHYLRRYPHGVWGRDLRKDTEELGAEWQMPFGGPGAEVAEQMRWESPLDMLRWLAKRYRSGLPQRRAEELKDDAWELVRDEYRYEPRNVRAHVGDGLFATSAALRTNKELARRAGFVVDDVWSRLKLVLPGDLRRRHLLAEWEVTWSRLFFAVTLGWVVFGAVVWSWFVVLPLMLAAWAILVGRRRVVRAYEMRVATADVYRFELAQRMRVALPASQTEFAGLGAVLTGKATDWALAPLEERSGKSTVHVEGDVHHGPADTSRLEEQLARVREELLREVGMASNRIEDAQRLQLYRAQREWEESTDRRLTGLPALLKQSVAEALSGPTMVNFTGYLAVEHQDDEAVINGSTIVAAPESQVGVVVSVLVDPGAQSSGPERGTESDRFMVLQPVHIEGGQSAPEAEFELVVDSGTMRPAPRRHTLRVGAFRGQAQVPVSLLVPAQEGRHEAWLQLFQSGQLVQAIMVVVEAAHA